MTIAPGETNQIMSASANTSAMPIYMDNHATTPLDPRVLETMMPFFKEQFGNSASRNHHGAQKYGSAQDFRAQEKHGCRNVGAI